MARSNFGYQKYQKEIKRKQKSEEKRKRSQAKRQSDTEKPAEGSTEEAPLTPDSGESPSTDPVA